MSLLIFFILYVWVSVHLICAGLVKARRRGWIPQNWSCKCLWATTWMLGIEPEYSVEQQVLLTTSHHSSPLTSLCTWLHILCLKSMLSDINTAVPESQYFHMHRNCIHYFQVLVQFFRVMKRLMWFGYHQPSPCVHNYVSWGDLLTHVGSRVIQKFVKSLSRNSVIFPVAVSLFRFFLMFRRLQKRLTPSLSL